MDELLREFVTETNESLSVVDAELVRFEQNPSNAEILARIFRLVHTIKGTCGFLGLPRLEALTHAAEALMGKYRDGAPPSAESVSVILATIDRIKIILDALESEHREPAGSDDDLISSLGRFVAAAAGAPPTPVAVVPAAPPVEPIAPTAPVAPPPALTKAIAPDGQSQRAEGSRQAGEQSIRVPIETLEYLMTTVSELVLTRNQLLEIAQHNEDSVFKAPLARLSNVTADLQDGVMKTRMQPIGNAWQKLPRIVRDLSTELGKSIDLDMIGSETELDRQILELIKDPLTHMVRNAADHGLETPEQRVAAGKSPRGRIRLAAYHSGGQIVIELSDDGRGLNNERIKAKAAALGLATADELDKMPAAQVQRFIFTPGFSTADKVTSVSGRGVGMDVVHSNIDKIGGVIDVNSVPGAGVDFVIRIPLTLAIAAALIVESAGQRYAIPQSAIVELVRLRPNGGSRIERIKNAEVLRLRNRLLPLRRLSHLLKTEADDGADTSRGFVVVMQYGTQIFGLVVDAVFHSEEIVVKPLSSKLKSISAFSGNTILGDGSVIMIIDPNGMVRAFGRSAAAAATTIDAPGHKASGQSGSTQAKSAFLLFRAGSRQTKAVPLSLVTRLEVVDAGKIETSNGQSMIQYRGHLMPLVAMNDNVTIRPEGAQPLLVFSDGQRSVALIVDEIVDIVEDHLDIAATRQTPGVLGSAIVNGQATEIVDVGHFLPITAGNWALGADRGGGRQPSVLLVDDSAFFRGMLMPVLQAAGFAVTMAAGGNEAMQILHGGAVIDAVVTDVDMPDMDGFTLASTIAADARLASLPIVGLSSLASAEMVARGRDAGFHDFVAKFDRQGLIDTLKEQTSMERAA